MGMTILGPDGRPRCRWCGAAAEFLDNHDTEWGFPVADDHRLFEKLSLEGFQSGLSWRTIRHRGKIEAVINNARRVQELLDRETSLAAFIWRYEPDAQRLTKPRTASTSAESLALAKELKRQGWRFVGPTTVYAFMQAMGLINDHVEDCVNRAEVERARDNFKRPE